MLSAIQQAFYSPFWPMVLASTFVGQEGVDFRWWCHSLVHWNLPCNPVDLDSAKGASIGSVVTRYERLSRRRSVPHSPRPTMQIRGRPFSTPQLPPDRRTSKRSSATCGHGGCSQAKQRPSLGARHFHSARTSSVTLVCAAFAGCTV